MEHLVIDFRHEIRDIIPFCDFIANVRSALESNGLGQYLYDDMAIDGGDAEVFFSCHSASALFEFLKDDLSKLGFMAGAKVTFVYGALDSGAPADEFHT